MNVPTESGGYSWDMEVAAGPYTLEGDLLTLNVGYGGCSQADFDLSWDGSVPETGAATLYLTRPLPPEMECMMYISHSLQFDLSPLKAAYIKENPSQESLTLTLTQPSSTEEPLTVNYSF